MIISNSLRQAYSEVDEFIELLDKETIYKIPQHIRRIFKEEKDSSYVKNINPNRPIKDQNLKEDTLAIIALLNLKYICEDEEERQRLRVIYSINEQIYRSTLQVGFNDETIFGKKFDDSNSILNEQNEKDIIKIQNDKLFTRIIRKLKSLFKNSV